MSQGDPQQGGQDRVPNDPRVNVDWTPAVSISEALADILKPGNERLFRALRSYLDVALVERFPGLNSEHRDELFRDAVAKLHGKSHLPVRFAYLFGDPREGQPGPFGPYVARAAKRLYLSEVRSADRAARREQKLIERQERVEMTRSPLDVLLDQENLDLFSEKLSKLFKAAPSKIDRRHWNALLEFIGARWPAQLGKLPPRWPGVVPATNQATRRSDRYRARAELGELIPEYGFNEGESALLRVLGVLPKRRGRDGGKDGK